jgi:hypothetical protein
VVKEEAIRHIVKPQELADDICRRAFIPDEAWTLLGLPEQERTEP